MIIAISGSVGSGKTTLAKELGRKLDYEVVHLNDWAKEFKLRAIEELQTFDFDIAQLLVKVETYIEENRDRNLILEGHFSHLINPKYVDYLFIINRSLKELESVYKERGYNDQKIKDNLECESFNLCFYEGIEEGYEIGSAEGENDGENIFCLVNNNDIDDLVKKIENKIN